MAVYLTAHGGAGTIGGNKLLLESGDRALWFDFGTDFRGRPASTTTCSRPAARPGCGTYWRWA